MEGRMLDMTSRHSLWFATFGCLAAVACSSSGNNNPGNTGASAGTSSTVSPTTGTAGTKPAGASGAAGKAGASGPGAAGAAVATAAGSGNTTSSGGSGPTTGTAGTVSTTAGAPAVGGAAGSGPSATPSGSASVLQFHKNANRDGHYVDAAFTRAAAAKLHRDPAFMATMSGPTFAQPLYFEGGPGGKDIVIVATETNEVSAFDATSGSMVWRTTVAPAGPKGGGPGGCALGNIDPLGVTGTPVIDAASRTLFVAAMTTGGKHQIHALAIEDGKPKAGWPLDVSTVKAGSLSFNSPAHHQRGALLILNGILYVPYGGHYGDCGDYHGWVVGVPIDDPKAPLAWATRASGGGIWAPSGLASDGKAVYVATGNTMASPPGNSFPAFSSPSTWGDGEAIIRLPADLNFTAANTDYFAPENWSSLDAMDMDTAGSGVLLFDAPGATPSQLAIALGKDGAAYLVGRENLGGLGGQIGAPSRIASSMNFQASVAYTTKSGTFVAMRARGMGCPGGGAGAITAVKVAAASPPTLSVAWCAGATTTASPIVTTTDGMNESIIWYVGGTKLVGYDGESGAEVFNGGAAGDAITVMRTWQTPAIVAKGRLYVASSDQLYAFTL